MNSCQLEILYAQVLEKLYRLNWGPLDGLGALVISPTRELALQIFDELRKMGKKHEFSAGLLIGGKKVKEEQERVHGETWPHQMHKGTSVWHQQLSCNMCLMDRHAEGSMSHY